MGSVDLRDALSDDRYEHDYEHKRYEKLDKLFMKGMDSHRLLQRPNDAHPVWKRPTEAGMQECPKRVAKTVA